MSDAVALYAFIKLTASLVIPIEGVEVTDEGH